MTAVVGRSLNNLCWAGEYDYGVDGSVRKLKRRGTRIAQTGFGFDFQSKTTTVWTQENGEIVYDLEADAYNDLAERSGAPRGLPLLLILLCLETDETQWLSTDHDSMVLRRCAYWLQIKGDFTKNTSTRRIRIPRTNRFDPGAVRQILEDVELGRLLP